MNFFCLLVVGVDDVAAHLIAEEPHIAGGAILIGPVGEIHTPRKAALGMALRLADDLEFVAAEVEAGKHLSADSLTVIVPPVVLFPRREPLRDMRREPPPEIGKIEQAGRPIRVLNLFAYTGAASVACAKSGASVCHVDAAKGMVAWAKENAKVSGLADAPIRWIVDDCAKFVEREIRRGKTYDAIIMDPPSYGRGPGGEVWKLEDNLFPFVKLCSQVLSDKPLFVIINSYTTGLAPSVLGYMLHLLVAEKYGGRVTWDELGLPVTETGLALPCGATGRWCSE